MRALLQFSLAPLLAALWLSASAQAQDLTFNYRTSASPAVLEVAANGQINLPAVAVGAVSSATIVVTNRGAVTYSLVSAQTNNPAFKATPAGSISMPPGGAGAIPVTFSPVTRGSLTDTLTLVFNTSLGQTVVVTFFLTGTGQSSDLLSSYLLPGGNQTVVTSGATILFPGTLVQQATTATFIVVNRGNAEGSVRSVSITGAAFTVSGLPLLPVPVPINGDVRFSVSFRPTALGDSRGALRVEFSDGVQTFNLQGSGTGASFSYEINLDGNFSSVAPGAAIRLPQTAVAGRVLVPFRIRNAGTSEGRVTVVQASGDAYRLQDLAPLPAVLPSGGTLSFVLAFSPPLSGTNPGRLLINETVFELSGEGLGPRLTFFTDAGGQVTPVPDSNLIVLPNTTVGTRLSVKVAARNEGNAPASVSGVSITGAQFGVADLPAFPATVAPGEALTFTLTFLPSAVGTVTGTLQLNERIFTVRGAAGNPPALPAVSLTNVSETAESLQQPAVGLTIAQAYASDISGKLTLGFTAESFGDDASIQFASGGRSVDFRIPANTREAVFADNSKLVQFQTGTVAGTITLGATFTVGSTDVTPSPAPVRNIAVASQPPRIRGLQIGARSAASFEILITGYSSTRALNQLTLQFAPAVGSNLATSSLTVNAESAFSSWYQGAASRPFGSQFTASLTINVAGDINTVQSVSVTGSNSKGASNAMTVNLR